MSFKRPGFSPKEKRIQMNLRPICIDTYMYIYIYIYINGSRRYPSVVGLNTTDCPLLLRCRGMYLILVELRTLFVQWGNHDE